MARKPKTAAPVRDRPWIDPSTPWFIVNGRSALVYYVRGKRVSEATFQRALAKWKDEHYEVVNG